LGLHSVYIVHERRRGDDATQVHRASEENDSDIDEKAVSHSSGTGAGRGTDRCFHLTSKGTGCH
jgi:hypothetical protein